MRSIFAFFMISVDGYHETAARDLSWHNVDAEFNEFAVEQLDEADTLLFGRRTYQLMAEFWPSPAGLQDDSGVAERMNSYQKVVVSRTLGNADWAPSTLISDDVPAQLRKLKEQPGRDIALLGSSTLAASLLDLGVIDELRMMVSPVILGAGHPVLAGARHARLTLARRREFRSGNELLTYRPAR